jgi:hypothetical protein
MTMEIDLWSFLLRGWDFYGNDILILLTENTATRRESLHENTTI